MILAPSNDLRERSIASSAEGKRDISHDDRSLSSYQPGRDRLVVRLFS